MKLRNLLVKDASYMLEWMHDPDSSLFFRKNFLQYNIYDCINFIKNSDEDSSSIHYAIVDDFDEYMGTISLKNIDMVNNRAEFAISCRNVARGKGYASFATNELFQIAKSVYGINYIYLNVYAFNYRAQKFYEKVGFKRIEMPTFINEKKDSKLLWYSISL